MWETIKNDPILKTVAIIILSVLGFGFAFNIMFGSNNTGMEHMSGSMGYSLQNTLSYIFILAFKLLIIVLIVAAFTAVFRFAGKQFSKDGGSKIIDSVKKDPVLKIISVVGLIIAVFIIIYYLFFNNFGMRNRYGMVDGSYGYYMMGNGGYGYGLSGLLDFLLKFLLAAGVIGVIIGMMMYFRQTYGKEIDKVKLVCKSCGSELKKEWKCCPSCGNEKGEKE